VTAWICVTCGVGYPDTPDPPDACPICLDERQYVGHAGQRWLAPGALSDRHRADVRELEPGLTGLGMNPSFAIGQRALLVQTPRGGLLWDCIPLLDDELETAVRARGGLAAIAISHPHYYATMVSWADRFEVDVHLHAADRAWAVRPSRRLRFWDGEQHEVAPGVTLLRLGGHFAGATVAHWAAGAAGRGALLSGDVVQVVADRAWVSFMRSYPNLIPLPATRVREIARRLAAWRFERIYGAWWDRVVDEQGAVAVQRSAQRYIAALEAAGGD
jgi:hypothetical protein